MYKLHAAPCTYQGTRGKRKLYIGRERAQHLTLNHVMMSVGAGVYILNGNTVENLKCEIEDSLREYPAETRSSSSSRATNSTEYGAHTVMSTLLPAAHH